MSYNKQDYTTVNSFYYSNLNDSIKRSLSASIGAIITSFIVTPFDVIKVRLQNQLQNQANKSKLFRQSILCKCNSMHCLNIYRCVLNDLSHQQLCPHLSRSVSSISSSNPIFPLYTSSNSVKLSTNSLSTYRVLRNIIRLEGISGLFSGIRPALLLSVPNTVLYYTSYDILSKHIRNLSLSKNEYIAPIVPLFSGSIARIFAATIISPIELIRTQMQSNKFINSQGILRILHNNSNNIFRGLSATLLRDVPFSAIYWTSYENIKLDLTKKYQYLKQTEISFISGCIAGFIAAIITTPFDVIKTLQQTEISRGNNNNETIRHIAKKLICSKGYKSLMAGLTPRLLKIVPSCGIMISTYEAGKIYFQLE